MWQCEGAYSHFEYVLLVSLGIVVMTIHFLSLELVLARVDLRTKTASLIWLQFIFRGFLWSFNARINGASRRFLLMFLHNDYLEKCVKIMCRTIKEEEKTALIFNLTNKMCF